MALNDLSLSERICACDRQCVHPYIYYRNGDCHYELFGVTKDGEIGEIVASSNIGDKALQKLKAKCNLTTLTLT